MNTETEPNLVTDPALTDILEQLKAREPIFHRPDHGTSRADFENMTVSDFWETGASGRRYSREYVLEILQERYSDKDYLKNDPWETYEFHCRKLAENVYLVTYTLFQGKRKTRRATIWQRSPQGWQVVYHQGTLVQDDSEKQ